MQLGGAEGADPDLCAAQPGEYLVDDLVCIHIVDCRQFDFGDRPVL
jgi:hypothetical protein